MESSLNPLSERNRTPLVSFCIQGKPIALKRHRSTRGGHMYDPSAKDKQEFMVKAREYYPSTPITGPLIVELKFIMPRPKSHFRTGKYAGQLKTSAPVHHTKTPDLDNLVKFSLDAMNKVFYVDDSQVLEIYTSKQYSETTDGYTYIKMYDLYL